MKEVFNSSQLTSRCVLACTQCVFQQPAQQPPNINCVWFGRLWARTVINPLRCCVSQWVFHLQKEKRRILSFNLWVRLPNLFSLHPDAVPHFSGVVWRACYVRTNNGCLARLGSFIAFLTRVASYCMSFCSMKRRRRQILIAQWGNLQVSAMCFSNLAFNSSKVTQHFLWCLMVIAVFHQIKDVVLTPGWPLVGAEYDLILLMYTTWVVLQWCIMYNDCMQMRQAAVNDRLLSKFLRSPQ